MLGARWLRMVVLAGSLGMTARESAGQQAPAAPTYLGVEQRIESIRQSWAKPGARSEPNADGWNSLFQMLQQQLQAYGQAADDAGRLTALNRLYEVSSALATVAWPPAAELREELRQWLRPRVRLAWARRRLDERLEAVPPSANEAAKANRSRWKAFVGNDLGGALREYDRAQTVQQRQTALKRLHAVLDSLDRQNREQSQRWEPSWELEAAMNDLFNRPNLDIAADVATVAPVFEANLVTTGPVTRKGYTSMVTAGPKTGFGLVPLDGGIGFYNSQSMVSVTPIHDFQQQIAQDPQGQKAAELYYFSATTYDWSNLTVTAIITPDGLSLSPNATHNIDASICAQPTDSNGLKRGIAALIGMNEGKIEQKVYEGALPKFQQQIPQEAAEEANERISVEQAERNADLRSKYLIGNDTAAVKDFLIKQLSMKSRPDAIFVGGRFEWRNAPGQLGADTPQPPKLKDTYEPGVTADLHLGSLLTSAAAGIWQQEKMKSIHNVMIETKIVPPGGSPKDAAKITQNVSYADYIKAVDEAKKANDPRVQALLVNRPAEAPEFSVDARGYLVGLIRDFQLDAPAPGRDQGGAMLGVPAKVLRIKSPLVEVAISYQVDDSTPGSVQIKGNIQEFNLGTTGEVIAINDDEAQAKPLTRFQSAIVMTALSGRIRRQAINLSLDQLKLPGFAIRSVSPLDPSGWARLNLVRVSNETPVRQTEPAEAVRPGPTHGPGEPGSSTPEPTGAAAATPPAADASVSPPAVPSGPQ